MGCPLVDESAIRSAMSGYESVLSLLFYELIRSSCLSLSLEPNNENHWQTHQLRLTQRLTYSTPILMVGEPWVVYGSGLLKYKQQLILGYNTCL